MRHRALLVGDIEENWVLKSSSDTPVKIFMGETCPSYFIYTCFGVRHQISLPNW